MSKVSDRALRWSVQVVGAVECCGADEQSEGCERTNKASHRVTLFKRDCYVLKQTLIAENVKDVKVSRVFQ